MSNVMFDYNNRDGEKKGKQKPLIRRPIARILAFTLSVAVFISIAGFGALWATEGDEQNYLQEIDATAATIDGSTPRAGAIATLEPNEIDLDGDDYVPLELVSLSLPGQYVFLKGTGGSFNEKWNDVFTLGDLTNETDPNVWHLVYTGNDIENDVTYMQVTFKKKNTDIEDWSYVFEWFKGDGFSSNPSGNSNNLGWVIMAPYDWEIVYVNKGNNNESLSYLVTNDTKNVNFNISGYHPGKPPVGFKGGIAIEKLVNGINIMAWLYDNGLNYDIDDLISFNLYLVSDYGEDIAGLEPIIEKRGIGLGGYLYFEELDDGWYAIEEKLTPAGKLVFEEVEVKYIQIFNGIQVGGGNDFDYSAFYTIVNGYGQGYTLGYPGLNNNGDIFPIAVKNTTSGIVYPSYCAHAGSANFAGESGLGCAGYLIADKSEKINYEEFVKAYNFIEASYGDLDDNRAITQMVTWILLGAIDVPSTNFDNIKWSEVETGTAAVKGVPNAKAKVENVIANYKSFRGQSKIIDVIFMVCEHDHDPLKCQPQLVPIYGSGGFNNIPKEYDAKGDLIITGTKIFNIVEPSAEDVEFTFTMLDVTGVEGLEDMTEEEIAALDLGPDYVVSTGYWTPGNHIEFETIYYGLGDVGEYIYRIKEDSPLPDGWSTTTPYILIYVVVEDNRDGSLSVIAYEDPEHETQIIELKEYLIFNNDYEDEKWYDAALRKWVSDVNGVVGIIDEEDEDYEEAKAALIAANPLTDVAGILGSRETANGSVDSPAVRVGIGDYIEYTIRVFNQCPWPLYIEGFVEGEPEALVEEGSEGPVEGEPEGFYASIVDNIPAGLNFVEDEGVNEGWVLLDGKIYYTGDIPMLWPEFERFNGKEGYDKFTFNKNDAAHPFYYDVKVILEVDTSAVYGAPIVNSAMILGITDEEGNVVEDVDSDFEQKELEEWYGTDEDNNINGNGKKRKGDDDKDYRIGDRDEHDIAIVYIQGRISVEVYKDTIKRTSAAFDGSGVEIATAAGRDVDAGEDINYLKNVGEEEYRYDIHFRSTSNVVADEFVVEDPLEDELFQNGAIRLTGLWTPAVWGDMDGRFNVYYRSAEGTGASAVYPEDPVTNDSKGQMYPADPMYGWKLWTTIDVADDEDMQDIYDDYGVISRVFLGMPDGFDEENDWITGLRFEYGQVKVGFTSCMGDVVASNINLNDPDNNTLRFTNGSDEFKLELADSIVGPVDPEANQSQNMVLYSTDMSPVQATTAFSAAPFSLEPFASVNPVINASMVAQQVDRFSDIPDPDEGKNFNWEPVPNRSDYPKVKEDKLQIALLLALAEDDEDNYLRPATYMVKAFISQMPGGDDEIVVVSSAIAYIGLMQERPEPDSIFSQAATETYYGLYDNDQDAVLTRFIVPFTFSSDPTGGDFTRDRGEDNDIRFDGAQMIDGVWYDRDGNRISTGDVFTLGLWLVLIACAAICLSLLIRTYVAAPGRKGKKKEIVPEVGKGGGM